MELVAILVALFWVVVLGALVAVAYTLWRELRRRSLHLDRIERRLDDIDRRLGPPNLD